MAGRALPETSILSIIVPVFNEEKTLRDVIDKVRASVVYLIEIVIVDDCSTDASLAIARSLSSDDPRIVVVSHATNSGKTAALRTGLAKSTGDVVIVQDADLEYDPADINLVVRPTMEGRADVVYGSRFLKPENARMVYVYQHAANRFLTAMSNVVSGRKLTDVETCYKAFRGDIIRRVDIESSGFGFEIEITAKLARLGCSIIEVPISYQGRTYAEGKKIAFSDFVSALWFIVYFNLLDRRRLG